MAVVGAAKHFMSVVCVWEGGVRVCAYDGVRVSLTISFVNSFSRTPNHLLTLSSTIC